MADSSGRAAQVARGQRASATSPSPDWETLPDDALFNILERVSSAESCSHWFMCRRWWSIARQVQRSLDLRGREDAELPRQGRRSRVLQSEERKARLRDVIARLPNLSSVHLACLTATDCALQALAAHCPRLVDLSLKSERFVMGRHIELTAPEQLGTALKALPGLQSLFLDLPLIALPASVSTLQNLKSLSLERAMCPLSDTFGALSSLTSLRVEGLACKQRQRYGVPGITALPRSMWQLNGLEELTLSGLELGRSLFPPELGNLTSLRRLTLQLDHLTTLTSGLTRLCNLEEMDLSCPRLRALPDGLHNLRKLRKLRLCAESFRSLPACLRGASDSGETPGLEDLTLKIFRHELTGGLACLSSTLRRLELIWCDHDLPNELGSLSLLDCLTVSGCVSVKHLPESLGDLPLLQELYVRGCKELRELPGSLGRCPRLRVFEVSGCGALKTLPKDLGNISTLRKLRLMGLPSLTLLPQSLANAQELQQLTLQGCPQASSFPSLVDLPRLDELSRRALRLVTQRRSRRISSSKGV